MTTDSNKEAEVLEALRKATAPVDLGETKSNEKKEAEVLAALRSVIDPEIGLDVVELGLIRTVEFNEAEKAKVTMILTTPFCPYGPQIVEQVRVTTNTITGEGSTVEIGTEMWDPSMMEEGAGGDWGLF